MTDLQEILGVDVEALIRKRAASSFRSLHHYPVELVRDALRRGASRIAVRLSRDRLEVEDDGETWTDQELGELRTLLDPREPALRRVHALEWFDALRGLGLLAAFAPRPRRVRILRRGCGTGLDIAMGRAPRPLDGPAPELNIIRVERRGRPAEERRVLAEWCRFSPREILLDGAPLPAAGPGPHMGLSIVPGTGGTPGGRVWLPPTGDACRVRLLEHGILVRLAVTPPDQGLLYEAAVECPSPPPASLREALRQEALRLLARAAQDRGTLPPEARDRLDELVFLHHRATGSRHIMATYRPFLGSGGGFLTLEEIRDLAGRGPVPALAGRTQVEGYDLPGTGALLLTARQWEHLEEHAGVPLVTPRRRPRRRGGMLRLLGELGPALRRGLAHLGLGLRVLPADALRPGERLLAEGLRAALAGRRCWLPGLTAPKDVRVELVGGGAWRPPATLVPGPAPRVLLARDHRDVRTAAEALERDPDLLPLVLPLLFDGHDGWL